MPPLGGTGHRISGDTIDIIGAGFKTGDFGNQRLVGEATVERLARAMIEVPDSFFQVNHFWNLRHVLLNPETGSIKRIAAAVWMKNPVA